MDRQMDGFVRINAHAEWCCSHIVNGKTQSL